MNECVYLWSLYSIMTSSKFWLQYSNIQDVSKKLKFCLNILGSTFDFFFSHLIFPFYYSQSKAYLNGIVFSYFLGAADILFLIHIIIH